MIMIGIFGGWLNWFIRGGGWKSCFPDLYAKFDLKGEDWYCGAIYGVAFAVFSAAWWPFGILAGLCMVAGATPAWGEYIGAMVGNHPDHGRAWGFWRMTLRGAWWGLCLTVPALAASWWQILPNWALFSAGALAAGLLQGAVYLGTILLFEKIPYNRVFNHWTCAEMIHGFLLWACLGLFP